MVIKGQKINDRYMIIRSIGEGGMANVYLAHDTILDRDVAIKILRGDLANDEKFVRRFQREALSASSLSHPNIVEMYDVGEDNGTYYIVMEYVEGKTIKQLIKRRGGLTLSESIDIMLQLTDGISQAHEAGIIHRDLKPQNILIRDDGCIKITDFGIAMALNSTQLTQTNSVMGSVHYLPPEQASGKGSSFRSDIYSMGILFYELLTGRLPFKGENAVEIALKHMRDPLPSVRKTNPAIPQSVENIIIKATAKNPKNRYADAKEMRDDLLTCMNDERLNEPKYEYPFPEHDPEDKAPVKKESKKEEEKTPVEIIDEEPTTIEEDEVVEKTNVWIWILTSILGVILLFMVIFFLVVPALTAVPNVTVPSNLTELSVDEAKSKLTSLDFGVEVIEEKNALEAGKIIRVEPNSGSSIKKGSKVTIYVSSGQKTVVLKDYRGEDCFEVQKQLIEEYGLDVTVATRAPGEEDNYENKLAVIAQEPAAGTEVTEGDKVTLYRAEEYDKYPDMVEEGWTLDQVNAFCEQYHLKLQITYEERSDYTPGMICKQSREAGTTLTKGTENNPIPFGITIAKEPSDIGKPSEEEDPTKELLPDGDKEETKTE